MWGSSIKRNFTRVLYARSTPAVGGQRICIEELVRMVGNLISTSHAGKKSARHGLRVMDKSAFKGKRIIVTGGNGSWGNIWFPA